MNWTPFYKCGQCVSNYLELFISFTYKLVRVLAKQYVGLNICFDIATYIYL